MKECIDEARLQAYWDGELSAPEMSATAAHLKTCVRCAAESRAVEAEMEVLTRAFAPQINAPVPTETLRARLNAAIARVEDESYAATLPVVAANEAAQNSFGARVRGWLQTLNLTPQAFAYSALTLLVAGMVGAFWWQQNRAQMTMPNGADADALARFDAKEVNNLPTFESPRTVMPEINPLSPPPRRVVATTGANVTKVKAATAPSVPRSGENSAPALLPGEVSYLNAIASLQKVVGDENNLNAQPKLRAVYEQNVALLDHAIQSSQRAARRDPQDTDAAQLLYSSYQSKVELMTAVAEQMQTVAEAR